MATDTRSWIDCSGSIVGAGLADVAVGDGPDFRAVLIAI
jgi:hypothetical protein